MTNPIHAQHDNEILDALDDIDDRELRENLSHIALGHAPGTGEHPDCIKCYLTWPCPAAAIARTILGLPTEFAVAAGLTDKHRAPLTGVAAQIHSGGVELIAWNEQEMWQVGNKRLNTPRYPEKHNQWAVTMTTPAHPNQPQLMGVYPTRRQAIGAAFEHDESQASQTLKLFNPRPLN